MSGIYIFLNGVLNRRVFWSGPAILLLLVIIPRLFNIDLLNGICSVTAYAVSFVLLMMGLKDLIPIEEGLRKEVLFYRGFGMGFLQQFIMRVIVILSWTSVLYFISASVLWNFSINVFFLMCVTAFSLLMFATLKSLFNNDFIYYLPILIYAGSLFWPLYVVPNPAYVLNAGLEDLFIYSSMYMVLYLLLSYKMYFYSWRRQCTL